ncbi:MAG TPA: hypothetical protein VLB82_05495 [Thermodesulfobacteriota bacterium]|nr:hypothetical protein [Thermodesulfobacteriota bacterium]
MVEYLTVYVELLNEGVPCRRPVPACEVEPGVYILHKTYSYHPDDEEWEFLPGDKVSCEERISNDGKKILVAITLVEKRKREW